MWARTPVDAKQRIAAAGFHKKQIQRAWCPVNFRPSACRRCSIRASKAGVVAAATTPVGPTGNCCRRPTGIHCSHSQPSTRPSDDPTVCAATACQPSCLTLQRDRYQPTARCLACCRRRRALWGLRPRARRCLRRVGQRELAPRCLGDGACATPGAWSTGPEPAQSRPVPGYPRRAGMAVSNRPRPRPAVVRLRGTARRAAPSHGP